MAFLKILSGIACLFLISAGLSGCYRKIKILHSPPHYKFSEEFPDKLDLRIQEISGIVWDTKKDEFICHNDEKGTLFFLDKETKAIKREIQFAGKGDYEDVTLYKGIPYVLRSDGMITKVVTDSTGKSFGLEAGKIAISGRNDFETLYSDTARKALVMICKNCAMDNKNSISAFAFYPDSIGFDNKPVYTIDAAKIRQLAPEKTSKKFQPSAAAIHPVLKKLFILSSASGQLAITDLNGNVDSVYVLSKKLFPQPEGITFKNIGDMYISNEGGISRATLLKFLYKP